MRLDSVAIASLLLFLDDTPLLLCRAFVSRVLLKQWTRCRGSLGRLALYSLYKLDLFPPMEE